MSIVLLASHSGATYPGMERLAIALVHFLWQGLLVYAAVEIALRLFRLRSPRQRYLCYLTGFATLAVCPLVTMLLVQVPVQEVASSSTAESRTASSLVPHPEEVFLATEHSEPSTVFVSPTPSVPAETSVSDTESQIIPASESTDNWQRVLVIVWFSGVVFLSLRLCFGVLAVHWLVRSRQRLPASLQDRATRLARSLGLKQTPILAVTDKVSEALAVGTWRPMVLLPVAWVSQLPVSVVEAVIAHELAHIRRWDLWVNWCQRVMETLLFYHPVVWWLSNRLRTEREHCCDELAVVATGERVVYARTLEFLARKKRLESRPVFAAGLGGTKMALLNRVRCVLGLERSEKSSGLWWGGAALLAAPLLCWGLYAISDNPANAEDLKNVFSFLDDEDERGEARRDGDREGEGRRERDGDRPREGEGRRDGDRPREGEGRRDGDRPREGEGRRDGDRPREGEGRRDGDRPREGEGRRDGDRPREGGGRRDGDRPREGEGRRDGDRPREGEGRRDGDRPRFREGDGTRENPFRVREGDRPREGDRRDDPFGPPREGERPRSNDQRELINLIRELQREVEMLRREVRTLRGGERPLPRREEERERPRVRDLEEREIERERPREDNFRRPRPDREVPREGRGEFRPEVRDPRVEREEKEERLDREIKEREENEERRKE